MFTSLLDDRVRVARGFLAPERAAALFAELLRATPWLAVRYENAGAPVDLPRLTVNYGERSYDYSGLVFTPLPWTPLLAELRAQVEPPAQASFNALIVQLYRDGHYVGAMNWNPQGTEKWSLSFGRDDLMQVRLAPVKGDTGTAGVFDKRNQRQITDQITVRSNHARPMNVLVIEAGPVSTSEEIRVQSQYRPKPTTESWDQRRGVVAWERTIAPQETVTFDVNYTIEYPKEGFVGGLR